MNQHARMPIRVLIAVVCAAVPLIATAQPCSPDDTTLCLSSNRFSASATWRKSDGTSGQGHAITVTGDTGYFWFFDPSNIEVVTKLLNACGVNNRYWVFGSGLTNVDVTLHYVDGATGVQQTYHNPQGTAFEPVQDTNAFSTCSTPTVPVADVSGTWAAVLTFGSYVYPTSLSLFQAGSRVSGTASVVGGGGGSVTGTVTGQTLQFTVNEVSPCPGSYSGTATVDGANLYTSGSLSGSDCNGFVSGSMEAAKTFVGGSSQGGVSVAGLWNATVSLSGAQVPAVIGFVQNGSSVTGTAVLVGKGSGSLTGSVVGNTLRFTVNELSPCFGIYLGEATLSSGSSIGSGTLIGADCGGTYSGTLSGTKQSP